MLLPGAARAAILTPRFSGAFELELRNSRRFGLSSARMPRWARQLLGPRDPSPPRTFASTGYTIIPPSEKVDEEKLEWYSPSSFYPVRIGEVFQDRYQVVSKLGYGSSATIWLCRDLRQHLYVALKVCMTNFPSVAREKAAFARLEPLKTVKFVQKSLGHFTVNGASGSVHECFVLEALEFNINLCRAFLPGQLYDLILWRQVALEVIQALDFLHSKANIVHGDLRHENILMRGFNDKIFQGMESVEAAQPSARKIDGDRVIHETPDRVPFPKDFKCAVLCDYGEARCSDAAGNVSYLQDIQPFPYRAPEVVLVIPWSYPVDIWNAGVMLWHLFENKCLFNPYDQERESNAIHLLEMMEVMGDPSPKFVRRSLSTDPNNSYFDDNGQWRLPSLRRKEQMSLESQETRLEGKEKAEFLRFTRRMLQWEPEKRATAAELLKDRWLLTGSVD
ncbi:hypothetical protein EVJ58_g6542 [Rhodofomes roseus]|uniref:non-specific serine/threonine protein kinase n=1 Tax=Rhodofomes roseus TaxID=34475 RepID=A0A4Y9Y6W2_9APHY|nr:hypothetical protein EVJ58_g6542 [Rhodofomes roseus]